MTDNTENTDQGRGDNHCEKCESYSFFDQCPECAGIVGVDDGE